MTLIRQRKEILRTIFSTSKEVRDYAKRFQRGHWSLLGSYSHKLKGKWDNEADLYDYTIFLESGHPIFGGKSALNRGILKRRGGRNTIHFTADSAKFELLFRTIHSANQLSICGAVSSWCEDFAEKIPGQTSMGVDRSVSKAIDPLSKQLNLQNVASQVVDGKRATVIGSSSQSGKSSRIRIGWEEKQIDKRRQQSILRLRKICKEKLEKNKRNLAKQRKSTESEESYNYCREPVATQKRWYVTEALVNAYGRTMGCPRCSGGIGIHNAECCGRIEGILLQQSRMKSKQEESRGGRTTTKSVPMESEKPTEPATQHRGQQPGCDESR